MTIKPSYEIWIIAPTDDLGTPGMGPVKIEREWNGQKGETSIIDTLQEAVTIANGMRARAYQVFVFERRVVRDLPGEIPTSEEFREPPDVPTGFESPV